MISLVFRKSEQEGHISRLGGNRPCSLCLVPGHWGQLQVAVPQFAEGRQ